MATYMNPLITMAEQETEFGAQEDMNVANCEGMNVANFLLLVDRQIYNLDLLKLSLYPVLPWRQLEACKQPSGIFRLLQEKSGSEETALQSFLFALLAIGGRKRGKYCVEEATKRLDKSKLPVPLNFHDQSVQFQFFHWLVKITKRIPTEAAKKMIVKFSKHDDIKSNPCRFKTIPELFVTLYQANIITEWDSTALERVLDECKKYCNEEDRTEIDECLLYLSSFRSEEPKDPFGASEAHSTASSLEASNKLETHVVDNRGMSARRNCEQFCSVSNYTSTTVGTKGKRSQLKRKTLLCGVCILIVCAVVATPAVVTCSLTVWSPLHDLASTFNTRHLHENAVVLAEMNSFFVSKVTISENVLSRDYSHQIDLYLTRQSCDHVQTLTTLQVLNGAEFMNTTPTYMIAGSTIDLHACVSTEGNIQSHIDFYVVRNADDSEFDPYKTVSHLIEVGRWGDVECTHLSKEIAISDYYYLVFLVPSDPLNISYAMILEVITIDTTALNSSYIGSVSYEDDSVSTSLAHWREDYCLIGDIYSYEDSRPFVHTEVTYSLSYGKILGLTLTVTLLWTISVTVLVIIFCHFALKRVHYKSGYDIV